MKKMFTDNNDSDSNCTWCLNYHSGFGVPKSHFTLFVWKYHLIWYLNGSNLLFLKLNKTTKQNVTIKLNSTLYLDTSK